MRKVLYLMGILDDSDIEWLAEVGRVQRVSKSHVLISANRPTEWLYIVLGGRLAVTLESGVEIAQLGKGEVLGEISFLDSRPASASVSALENAEVLALPRETITMRLETNPGFAARFYRGLGMLLADRLRATSWQLGYLRPSAKPLQPVKENPADELDDTWAENISYAAARFQNLLDSLGVAR